MASTEMYLTQSADIASRTIGDDTIIMSTQDSTVFMLNSVGTAIWNAADGATPLSRIIQERVCQEFDVSDEQALADAMEFVDKLVKHGILSISDAPVVPIAKPEGAHPRTTRTAEIGHLEHNKE
jgi:hypothetical protein